MPGSALFAIGAFLTVPSPRADPAQPPHGQSAEQRREVVAEDVVQEEVGQSMHAAQVPGPPRPGGRLRSVVDIPGATAAGLG
ncbi:hypothetical protein GCM10010219_60140 [Streptomyces netropsis]|nr:hypothetical protein GCM10010219_60140 [Streptomyces netropsis]